MPDKAPEGYTHIEEAVARWGRNRAWWYEQVREGAVQGYKFPGLRGTYLRDDQVAAFLKARPVNRGDAAQNG